MKNVYLTVLCIVMFGCCYAQSKATVAAATLLTSFPFKQYSGGVMMVKAKLGNVKDSFNFILDTGCGGISLDSSACAENNILPTPTDTTITVMGNSTKVSFVFNQQLHFPGLTVSKLNFHVNNYEVLTSVYGERIDGIIGYSFFSRYIVKINFDSSLIHVFSPGKIKYDAGGMLLHPRLSKTIPVQELTIRDKKKINSDFYFDTGAGLNFLMSESYLRDSNILVDKKKTFDLQGEGVGGKLRMKLTVIKSVQLGKYKFRNVPSYIYGDTFNVTAYPATGGLLGNDLLKRFNLTINYGKSEIHIVPNQQFAVPFDYSYTGIAVYYVGGIILIDNIVAGSPADEAGIKTGDVLISVGEDDSNNIMQYKTALQTAREIVRIKVKRKGQLLSLAIKPVTIL